MGHLSKSPPYNSVLILCRLLSRPSTVSCPVCNWKDEIKVRDDIPPSASTKGQTSSASMFDLCLVCRVGGDEGHTWRSLSLSHWIDPSDII